MTRLQKKCFYAAAFAHLLLFVILVVGPAFLQKRKPEPAVPFIELVQISDASPAPAVEVQAQQPPPEPVRPVERPPRPTPEPRPPPEPARPVEPAPRPMPRPPVQVDLTQRVQPSQRTPQPDPRPAQDEARELELQIQDARRALEKQLSASSTIQVPVGAGAAVNDYARRIREIYERRWTRPSELSHNRAEVGVEIVVARNGRVSSRRITRRSGIADLDRSIERAIDLDRLPEFPPEMREAQQTFNITFVLTAD